MTERDYREYLNDVVHYAEAAVRVASGHDTGSLIDDEEAGLALERAIEIVGEASGRVPEKIRERYADVPWRQMVGTRNRLAHGYFGTNHELLLRVAQTLLPELLPRLREIAARESELSS